MALVPVELWSRDLGLKPRDQTLHTPQQTACAQLFVDDIVNATTTCLYISLAHNPYCIAQTSPPSTIFPFFLLARFEDGLMMSNTGRSSTQTDRHGSVSYFR